MKLRIMRVGLLGYRFHATCANCEKRIDPGKGVTFPDYHLTLCKDCVCLMCKVVRATLEKCDKRPEAGELTGKAQSRGKKSGG